MSDAIGHECGIALIRLRKPLQHYIKVHGSPSYAINKLYLLMQKQHNRGQDGAGVACVKLDMKPGRRYIDRMRSVEQQPIMEIFGKIGKKLNRLSHENPEKAQDAKWLKNHVPFIGEVYMGHLRYGTHGKNSVDYCHPMMRRSNWRSRNLLMAGNFNMTNVDDLFDKLVELGQHPVEKKDTVTVLEKIGHFLDEECVKLARQYSGEGLNQEEITEKLENNLDLQRVLRRSCKDFDGGYAMMGVTGHGATFVARDPAGIRPVFYFADKEVIVVASEKTAIKTAFNVEYDKIKEIEPGHALIIHKNGDFAEFPFIKRLEKRSCSFERIYFSRGSDPTIYGERKKLGDLLCSQILKTINYDLENTVFSYIPNTAETAFLGMMKGLEKYLLQHRILSVNGGEIKGDDLEKILSFRPRVEKLVIKDAKLRTFIADNESRDELVTHVYDTTYEVIRKGIDTIVVIDDSIVRGTTLEKSIINMLDRLRPKRIVVVSSAPQIRYPDCYGIDMSKLGEFVAFRAMLALLEEHKMKGLLKDVYKKCKNAIEHKGKDPENHVKELYDQFSQEQLSEKIAQIIKLPHIRAEVSVVFQTVDNLHVACPNHSGDWYFTGDYPTPGGRRVANKAFVNFIEGSNDRSY